MMRSRVVAVPLAVLALAGAGVAAYGAVGDDSVRYRTVQASLTDIEQTLDLSGVVEASGRRDLSFGTAGTVGDVRVSQGDQVEEGDVVAVLDRSSLRAAVDRATADLAEARAQLVEDRAAQSSVVEAAATATQTGSSGSTTTDPEPERADGGAAGDSSGSGPATAAVLAQLAAQQDAVITAQTAATTALGAATTALATQQDACANPVVDAGEGSGVEGVEGGGGDDGEGRADTATGDTAAVVSEECTTALVAVQAAQTTAADAQASLQKALETLGGTLTEALSTLSAGGSTGTGGSPSPGSAGNSSDAAVSVPSGSASQATGDAGASGMTRTVTAATLAADQAAIDSARAALLAAKAELAGAIVRAPADGTVASLSVAREVDVAAGDTVAILVAPGLTTVSVDVTVDQARQLEVGMAVEATPAGSEEALTGSVSRIDHVTSTDATSSGSDPTYGVEMVLDERDLALPDGMPASVTVVVGSAEDVVTVPASAVSDGVVTLVEGEETRQVRVATGIVASTRIEITDGVEEGDRVVLADLEAEVGTGDAEQTGPAGRFGGGGFSGGPPSGGMLQR